MKENYMGRMFCFLFTLLLAYAILVGGLYVFQRQLIYHPDKNIGPPEQYGLKDFFDSFVTAADGEHIQTWYHPAAPGFPTILYYHGNAYNLGDRAPIFSALADKGFGVMGVSYRGYGKSSGSPTEGGLYMDARAGMEYLTQKQHIPLHHIILFGESLGTGVAVQMAIEYDVGGLVLQSPYTAVAARAAEIHFYVPVSWMIKDHFFTIHKISRVKAPLLIFHGERDTTIPIAHGKAVFDAATSPKQAIFFPEVSHYDFDSQILATYVDEFAQKYKLIKK